MFNKIQRAMKPHWYSIYHHPFNQGLHAGTLPIHAFYYFLKHDKYYLCEFSKCLRQVGVQVSKPEHQAILFDLSSKAHKTHENLHDKYFTMHSRFKLFSNRTLSCQSENNVVKEYINHLHQTVASKTPLIALSSLFACYLVYSSVGLYLHKQNILSDNPYRLWVDSYSSKDFLYSTNLMIELLNAIALHEKDNKQEQHAIQAFMQSVSFELALWDVALLKHNRIVQNSNINRASAVPPFSNY